MSRIILPPGFILPIYHFAPYHFAPPPLEIFECTPFTHVLYHFAPYHFAPWKLFHDLHYLPMSHIILPPGFILPPGNGLMIYTIYSCPVSFCHCIRLLFHTNKKPFTTKAYDRRASGDCGTSGSPTPYTYFHVFLLKFTSLSPMGLSPTTPLATKWKYNCKVTL